MKVKVTVLTSIVSSRRFLRVLEKMGKVLDKGI